MKQAHWTVWHFRMLKHWPKARCKQDADLTLGDFSKRPFSYKTGSDTISKNLIRSLDFCATDSCFLIPDYLGEHRYWQVDYSGKPIRSIGKIPTEKDLASEIRPALAQAWRSFIDYNPHNGILAMVTQLGESIEIYNTKENTHTVLYGPNGEPRFKSIKGEGFPTGIMGFSDIVITDKYIYSVFQGIRFKDKLASYQRGEKPEDGGRYIYVFDLKGNPIQNTP